MYGNAESIDAAEESNEGASKCYNDGFDVSSNAFEDPKRRNGDVVEAFERVEDHYNSDLSADQESKSDIVQDRDNGTLDNRIRRIQSTHSRSSHRENLICVCFSVEYLVYLAGKQKKRKKQQSHRLKYTRKNAMSQCWVAVSVKVQEQKVFHLRLNRSEYPCFVETSVLRRSFIPC